MAIKGISKSIEEVNTGSAAAFHRIEHYSVDMRSKYVSLIVRGYVTEAACDNGKLHIMETTTTIAQAPALTDNVLEFLYKTITAVAPEAIPSQSQPAMPVPVAINAFAGAELVYEVVAKVKK
ncbi:hypothetical protein [Solimicrobium silvestre]|uniref:Uncharacterized protein n=1 Tax=Solimicrobium silvestre TaxID=2099400 RepID=A0A2S9GZH1_9BURK|nr:hypothetical protein [Solimicrobium silvestre]PRC93103.1 hypothetical protein S2091_2189 [Solimicrobium silvestre]